MSRIKVSTYEGPFNSSIEVGLRALTILNDAFPKAYSLQRLLFLDYFIVHSDDLPNGPTGLHPQTPHRSGELLVRRNVMQDGLSLYQSRGLIERHYEKTGVYYAATEKTSSFLDMLNSEYTIDLRARAAWLEDSFGEEPDSVIEKIVHEHIGKWGAEFEMESVLWEEELP